MIIKEIRRKNLQYWADKLGRGTLAEKAGYKDTVFINQLYQGHENMGNRVARKIDNALGLDVGWFDTLHPELYDINETGQPSTPYQKGKVPVLSLMTAGDWCDWPDSFEPGDADEWLDCPFPHSKSSAYFKVIGHSMYPEYEEGEYILADPEVAAEHGDDVIIRNQDGQKIFKRLQITPEGTHLMAINKDHPDRIIKIPPNSQICGVVTASYKKRR